MYLCVRRVLNTEAGKENVACPVCMEFTFDSFLAHSKSPSPAVTTVPRVLGHHSTTYFNSFPLGKMAAILADDIFTCIFVNEIFFILIKITLKFVPKGPIDNNQALV